MGTLNIYYDVHKCKSFVASCTNGYIYYAPTAKQLRNLGRAQEESDCLLAPEWQNLYEAMLGNCRENLLLTGQKLCRNTKGFQVEEANSLEYGLKLIGR